MRRVIPTIAFALLATALTVQAQETTVKSKTKSSGGDAKKVTYTGCVQSGTEAKSFVLDQVVPLADSGSASSFLLVPGDKVEVQSHVGRKVEVTGLLVPAGDVKTETTTEVHREHAKDSKTTERTETKNAPQQFQVLSIKDLGERCN
jgi:ribosome-associated protein YbcJ (S4-like RNA binding protein)